MKTIALFLLLSLACASAQAFLAPTNPPAQYTLTWSAPASTPGPLTYNLYFGVGSGQYTNRQPGIGTLSTQWTAPARGVKFFLAVTCTDTNGLESPFSNEISITPKSPPGAPSMTPPVTLVAQSAPTINGPWTDEPETQVQISPALASSFFKLRLVAAAALVALKQPSAAVLKEPPVPWK